MQATTDISPLQIIANQINALKSTGPRTEEGKNIAKFNARRHGLTGQFYCMSLDDEKAYQAFEANMLPSLRPEGAYEIQLAIAITQDHWRLNRSKAVEFNLYGKGHDRHADHTDAVSPNVQTASTMADTYREDDRHFANIALYETRIHRMIAKNEKRLAELHAIREGAAALQRTAEAAARADAELLVRLSQFEAESPRNQNLQDHDALGQSGLNPENVDLIPTPVHLSAEIEVNDPENVRLIPTPVHLSAEVEVNDPENVRLIPTPVHLSAEIEVNDPENVRLIPTPVHLSAEVEVNGFVFSTAQILLDIQRADRLATAKLFAKHNWDRYQIDSWTTPRLPKAA